MPGAVPLTDSNDKGAVMAALPKGRGAEPRHRLGVTLFLVAAGLSFLLSIGLWFTDNRDEGVFVGLWVPSILAAGAFWIAAVRSTS